jgi:transcriptional regulator with XRE-family HTH domain
MHLSDYMARKGLSDEQVAAAIGKNRVSVSRYRRRKIRPSWEAVERIREFTKNQVTAEDWLKREAAE